MPTDINIDDILIAQNKHWRGEKFPYGIERNIKKEIEKFIKTKYVLVIAGVRRAGKSYLLFQMINDLLNKIKPKNILVINFDDPALTPLLSENNPLEKVYRTYIRLKNPKGKKYLFFDEIQNLPNWEKWIKSVYDSQNDIKITITGSNATLLSAEMSTLLTGRNIKFEIFPFNFPEFLKAKGQEIVSAENIQKTYEKNYHNRDIFQHYLMEYIKYGAFPEVVLSEDEAIKEAVLKTYYQDILYRDIVPRFEIRHSNKLENLAYYLITNVSNHFSYNNLGKTIGMHENTAKEFLSFFEKAYLIFSISKFHYSTKQQIKSTKKGYCIDTGLRNALAFKFSEDIGRLTENIVYIKLKQSALEIYYQKNKKEVDFVIKKGLKVTMVVQVCWDLKTSEVEGLLHVLKDHKLKEGTIITNDTFNTEKIEGYKIHYIPLWLWLLV